MHDARIKAEKELHVTNGLIPRAAVPRTVTKGG
jgi:hypothetical protein